MTTIEKLRANLFHAINPPTPLSNRELASYVEDLDLLVAAAREEGYRDGCIDKDTEWIRGYTAGWNTRKTFEPGGGRDYWKEFLSWKRGSRD